MKTRFKVNICKTLSAGHILSSLQWFAFMLMSLMIADGNF